MFKEYFEDLNGILERKEAERLYEECRNNIPAVIGKEGPDAEDIYVRYEWMKKCWESTPYAHYEYTGKDGEKRYQDLAAPNFRTIMARGGATIQEQEEASQIREKYFVRFAQKIGVVKKMLNKVLRPDYPIPLLEHGNEALEMYGKFHTHEDVQAYIYDKRGYKVPLIKLKLFFNDHINEIQSRRNSYVMQNKEFRVATEAGRLETLNNMLTQYEIAMQRNPNNLRLGDLVLKVLEQARKECKGERLFLTVDGKIDVNAMLHGNDNVMTSLQRLPVNLMVIGIVAAKAGINPVNLIAQLAGSYYKDFNGFGKIIKEGNDVDRPSELIRLMDWEEVGKKVNTCPYNELGDLESSIPIEEENIPAVEDKRSQLLKLLEKDMNSPRVDLQEVNDTKNNLKELLLKKKETTSRAVIPEPPKPKRGRPKKDDI